MYYAVRIVRRTREVSVHLLGDVGGQVAVCVFGFFFGHRQEKAVPLPEPLNPSC